jgi:hypothetical protein
MTIISGIVICPSPLITFYARQMEGMDIDMQRESN